MGLLFGHQANTIVPQADFQANQQENGGWKATQSFRIRKGDIDNLGVTAKFPAGATLVSLSPDCDIMFQFLRLTSIKSVQDIPGGWQEIRPEFVGFAESSSTSDPPQENTTRATYSKRGVLVEAPINESAKWNALSDASKSRLGLIMSGSSSAVFNIVEGKYGYFDDNGDNFTELTSGFWATPTGDELEFAKKIAQGRTTYKLGTYEYQHRWQANTGISAATMNDLGKIATPSGSPPAPGTGRNWMMVGVDEEQSGAGEFMFDNCLTYLLSDEGGHDSFLYGP